MNFSLCRLILYVQDVGLLSLFYQQHFGLNCIESIPGEWAVLQSGQIELALHRAGPGFRQHSGAGNSNAKIVFETGENLESLHKYFTAAAVPVKDIKSYTGFAYRLLDGTDPEGNVFQLMQKNQ